MAIDQRVFNLVPTRLRPHGYLSFQYLQSTIDMIGKLMDYGRYKAHLNQSNLEMHNKLKENKSYFL